MATWNWNGLTFRDETRAGTTRIECAETGKSGKYFYADLPKEWVAKAECGAAYVYGRYRTEQEARDEILNFIAEPSPVPANSWIETLARVASGGVA